jgi:hypothetical protein
MMLPFPKGRARMRAAPSPRRAAAGLILAATALGAPAASANVIVSLVPSTMTVAVGDEFTVDIVADADSLLLGFGIDILADAILGPGSVPTEIGPAWTPVLAPDGDGLAGLAPVEGLTGAGILLATVSFEALAPGLAHLDIGATAGDLTEGFPLKAGGFDTFDTAPATVHVVPEPSTLILVALGLLGLAAGRST